MKQYMSVAPDGRVDGLMDRSNEDDPPVIDGYNVVEVATPFTGGWPKGSSETEVLYWDVSAGFTWVETSTLDELKARKNTQINEWRASANTTTFPYQGKNIACDALSRSDIDGVANHVGLFGVFPEGFPMAWKATDNTYVPIPDVAAFKSMYSAMTAQGTANFEHAQSLKQSLANATTAADVDSIKW